jgi:Holliday junction resolvasome RuvABC endonuclease subunit
MKILCLDPSLRAFGWAVIENNDFIDGGCIETKPVKGKKITDADTDALSFIATSLKDILTKYKCQKIVFENAVGSKSGRANQSLAYVKGLVVAICVFHGVEFETIKAKSVKKKLTLNNNATKSDVLIEVQKNFKSFDKKVGHLPKFKLYAVSDAAAVFLGLDLK